MNALPNALLVPEVHRPVIYPPGLVRETGAAGAVAAGVLPEAQVFFSTWGMPEMDAGFLDALPALRARFYAAGSVRGFVTPAVFERMA